MLKKNQKLQFKIALLYISDNLTGNSKKYQVWYLFGFISEPSRYIEKMQNIFIFEIY